MSTRYFNLLIDGQQLDITDPDEIPVSISYKREDPENFQSKKSAESFNIETPATPNNDIIANTFHNPGIEDLTPDQRFSQHRSCVFEANGYELLVGKAFLVNARHASCPISYEWNLYGNNADWIIPLKEATIYDFLKHINFTFTKELIEESWYFDGTDPDMPFVFAPVRYGEPFANKTHVEDGNTIIDAVEYSIKPEYMRPALSVYWLLYWGFKSLGYRIQSNFFNTEYFRRLVMPWTWGNFLYSEGTRLDNLDFLAKSSVEGNLLNVSYTGFFDAHVDNDSTGGAFDNQGVYEYDSGDDYAMKWTYLPAMDYGSLEATFRLSTFIDARATANSDVELYVRWYKNDVQIDGQDTIVALNAPTIGSRQFMDLVDSYKSIVVEPGDVIKCRLWADNFDSDLGRARLHCRVEAFELDYFRIPLGGNIDFSGYASLKKYKWIDFLAGILDAFNISPATDPINRIVVLEPEHAYSLTADPTDKVPGFINGNYLVWDDKQDLSKESNLYPYSDGERELVFKFKDDGNDGLLKKVQDRNQVVLSQAKYLLPDRFKAGKKEVENRFFSPVIHGQMLQWKGMIGAYPDRSPQIVCMIPENISNTSRDEAQNTFGPKLCYYKGLDETVAWIFDNVTYSSYPFMFAVNYMGPEGVDDPILSYSDELIDEATAAIGAGLLRRFYLQRMAIQRNGQYYNTHFRLNNLDVSNWFHREHITCRGQKWEIVEINDHKPLVSESTACVLRKHTPVSRLDDEATFPSRDSITNSPVTNSFDLKYFPLKCLASDIPKTTTTP